MHRPTRPHRRQFLATLAALGVASPRALAERAIRNGPTHDGTPVMADLDVGLRIRNTVGTDKKGLCVWASLTMGARYHNCDELSDLFADMTHEPGGGWPSRVDEKMKRYAPHIRYEQYLGGKLDFIAHHVRKGRLVCATYGYGEIYQGTIAHMICVVGMDEKQTAVLDNNDPEHIWWMNTAEYGRRFRHPNGQGWAVALHLPPPPPPPHNLVS